MSSISERIASIISKRRDMLPRLEANLDRCEAIRMKLDELEKSVSEAIKLKPIQEFISLRDALRDRDPRVPLSEAISHLTTARNRFQRTTINIGVSGRARVGKSTLLQTISGLEEQQIPTGNTDNVTAVKSRITNVKGEGRALITYFSFEAFKVEILEPMLERLEELTSDSYPVPANREAFKLIEYPEVERDSDPEAVTLRNLLVKEIQASFPEFESYLTGETSEIELKDLRPFVAYPTPDELNSGGNLKRLYLAVKSVVIEVPFPEVDVQQLTLIDLPGLGDLAPSVQQHHVVGLRNDVDLVVMVKRPVTGMGTWSDGDVKASKLLDKARGPVEQRDFTFLLANIGGIDSNQEKAEAMLNNIQHYANEGKKDSRFRVIQANAKDPQSVRDDLLVPLLNHLADRLPHMDELHLQDVQQQFDQALGEVDLAIQGFNDQIKSLSGGGVIEDVVKASEKLRLSIVNDLRVYTEELREQSDRRFGSDTEFEDEISRVIDKVDDWIDSCFGADEEAWRKEALSRIRQDMISGSFAAEQLNSIRVHMSQQYAEIDLHLDKRVDALIDKITEILTQYTGKLVSNPGRAGLEEFVKWIEQSEKFAPDEKNGFQNIGLHRASSELLSLTLSYRSHFHPQVRQVMNAIEPQKRTMTGQSVEQRVQEVPGTEDGVQHLLETLSNLAVQANYNARSALLEEIKFVDQAIFAAAEQFEDGLIRGGKSNEEFLAISLEYRDAIWPDRFAERERFSTLLGTTKKIVRELFQLLKG